MARRPITWRTINAPSFNSGALATAVNAFRSAGAGADSFTDQMLRYDSLQKEQATNQAISEALRTGQVGNLSSQADAASVWDAVLGKRRAESDLQTAEVGRRVDRARADQLEYENTDDYRGLQEDALQTGINADQSTIDYNNFRASLERRDDAEAQTIKGQSRTLDQMQEQFRERARQEYLSQNVAPGAQPTADQLSEARIYAEQAAQGPEGRQFLRQFATENNYLPESWRASMQGGYDAQRADAALQRASNAAERESVRAEYEDSRQLAQGKGDFTYTIYDPNTNSLRAPLSKQEAEIEKIGTLDEAISKIADKGVNVNQLLDMDNKEERDLLDYARRKLPNASLLSNAISTFIGDDGELDVEGFRDAVNKSGQLAIQQAINERRVANGQPPITDTTGDVGLDILGGSTGGGAATPDGPSIARRVTRRQATGNNVSDYTSRLSAAEQIINSLPSDATGRQKQQIDYLKRVLSRAKGKGDLTEGNFTSRDESLQILENLLNRYTSVQEDTGDITAALRAANNR